MNLEIEHIRGYGILSFAKNMGENLSNMYSQKLIDSVTKTTTDAVKTAPKRAIQKTAKATDDLIGSKIADKITSVSKTSKELHSQNNFKKAKNETEIPKERYISPEK